MEVYRRQAESLYGNTAAYKEYRQKAKDRTPQQEKDLGAQVMDLFSQLGALRPCAPDSEAALAWAKQLQAFFTAHYYNCTPRSSKPLPKATQKAAA